MILNCDGKLIRRSVKESSGDVDFQEAEHGLSLFKRTKILRAELDVGGKVIFKVDYVAKSYVVELLYDIRIY